MCGEGRSASAEAPPHLGLPLRVPVVRLPPHQGAHRGLQVEVCRRLPHCHQGARLQVPSRRRHLHFCLLPPRLDRLSRQVLTHRPRSGLRRTTLRRRLRHQQPFRAPAFHHDPPLADPHLTGWVADLGHHHLLQWKWMFLFLSLSHLPCHHRHKGRGFSSRIQHRFCFPPWPLRRPKVIRYRQDRRFSRGLDLWWRGFQVFLGFLSSPLATVL